MRRQPSTGGVLNITAAVWNAGFHWWRSGNKKRTQNVSEYMLVLALCLVPVCEQGCPTRVSFWTPVFTGHDHGRRSTLAMNTVDRHCPCPHEHGQCVPSLCEGHSATPKQGQFKMQDWKMMDHEISTSGNKRQKI